MMWDEQDCHVTNGEPHECCRVWLENCYFAHNSLEFPVLLGFCERDLVVLFIHFIATLARMLHKELTAVTSRS